MISLWVAITLAVTSRSIQGQCTSRVCANNTDTGVSPSPQGASADVLLVIQGQLNMLLQQVAAQQSQLETLRQFQKSQQDSAKKEQESVCAQHRGLTLFNVSAEGTGERCTVTRVLNAVQAQTDSLHRQMMQVATQTPSPPNVVGEYLL